MRRALATVELVQDDDGSVSARVETKDALDEHARRAVVRAVAAALEVEETSGEWEAEWEAEIARRRASLADGTARTWSIDEVNAKLQATARGSSR